MNENEETIGWFYLVEGSDLNESLLTECGDIPNISDSQSYEEYENN